MKRLRAYKTKLVLNNAERNWCMRCAGAARWCYNWGLDAMKTAHAEGRKTSVLAEKKRLNAIKNNVAPWLRDLPYAVEEEALRNLDTAYQNFFRRVKQGKAKAGFPKFKTRKAARQSFALRGSLHITDTRVKLPRIGWLRLAEHGYLPTGKASLILVAHVSTDDHGATWYISVQVEEDVPEPAPAEGEVIGIDVGIHSLAALSDGTIYDNPRAFLLAERKIARLNRELARRTKGGANWTKTKAKLNRAYARTRNIRRHCLHQVSADVVARRPSVIVMEDLNVLGMEKRRKLAKAVLDTGMYELHRQIAYKADWSGSAFVQADMWEPSSKRCSACGEVKSELALRERTYVCEKCGLIMDRDLNAAKNLAALAYQPA